MSLQPGEPSAGAGTEAAVEAAQETDDPGALQVDLDDEDSGEAAAELVGDGLAPGVHESDKGKEPAQD